jgi:hypothetical protein
MQLISTLSSLLCLFAVKMSHCHPVLILVIDFQLNCHTLTSFIFSAPFHCPIIVTLAEVKYLTEIHYSELSTSKRALRRRFTMEQILTTAPKTCGTSSCRGCCHPFCSSGITRCPAKEPMDCPFVRRVAWERERQRRLNDLEASEENGSDSSDIEVH